MTASEPLWPAAVSERAAVLVHGPARSARVLGTFPTALYLQVGGHARVLPVVTPDGLRLPTALAVATSLPTVGWGVQPGDDVVVGGGDVLLPGVTIRAVRTWHPHRVPTASVATFSGAPLATLALPWRAASRVLTEGLLSGDERSLPPRVQELVGRGPGLTPSGDDVLCGVMLALRLHPRGSEVLLGRLWRAVRPLLATTTSLSAALLTEAARGYAVAPVVRLTEALAGADRVARTGSAPLTSGTDPVGSGVDEVPAAIRAVLSIGHSSGADLLGGLAGCLDALDALGAAGSREAAGALPPADTADLLCVPDLLVHSGRPAMTPRSLQ